MDTDTLGHIGKGYTQVQDPEARELWHQLIAESARRTAQDGELIAELLRLRRLDGVLQAEELAYQLACHGRDAAIGWLRGRWYHTGTNGYADTAAMAAVFGLSIKDGDLSR
jgi:hypothetical protein